MSECIVRMEMPQDGVCDGCGARDVDSWAGPICSIKKKFLGSRRPSWCPIICQLPDRHGRLVDADEIQREMYHGAFETDTDMQKWDSGCWIRYKMFENTIGDAPTIVPAERIET